MKDRFFGLGGREFGLSFSDEKYNDFKIHPIQKIRLGHCSQDAQTFPVKRMDLNDPRLWKVIYIRDLDKYPVYIRYNSEKGGKLWHIRNATIIVNPAREDKITFSIFEGNGGTGLWLGNECGEFIHLRKI